MKRARIVFPLALCFIAMGAHADAESKRAKLLRLMELQGLNAKIEAQLARAKSQILELGQQQVAKLQASFPEQPAEYWSAYPIRMAKMAADFDESISPEEAAALWVEAYGKNLSEPEVDQILAYWESPIGQKDLAATNAATPEWQAAFSARATAGAKAAVAELNAFLRAENERLGAQGQAR